MLQGGGAGRPHQTLQRGSATICSWSWKCWSFGKNKFWGMVRMETIEEKEVRMRGRQEDLWSRRQEGLALDHRRRARLSLTPPGPPGEDAQHSSRVLSLCILLTSIIQCGSKFIIGKNWLSKLPLFFSMTKKMFTGRKEDDILNPKLHTYIKHPKCQMGD